MEEVNSTNKKARSKMKKTERRTFTVRDIEARQAEDGTMRMAGYAAVFNEASLPLPFIEKIAPGAFSKTLQETPDVRLLANHEGLPMARTKNGTMRLYEDETGLYFEAELANTQEARDLYTLVARGDVDQMSFAFRVIRQNWSKDRTERTLTEVSLADGDVSIVTYPAYTATSVEAREALKKAVLQIKEGREVTGDSLLVLESVFGDLSEGHEYIMKAVEVMGTLLGNNGVEGEMEEDSDSPLEQVEGQELEMSATNVIDVVDIPGQGGKIVGDFPSVLNFLPDNMPRSMSLRLAQAKRNTIK
jgi:HK97 family phage prohead protease